MLKDVKIKLEESRIRSLNFKVKDGISEENMNVPMSLSFDDRYNYRQKCINMSMHISIGDDKLPFVLEIEYAGLFILNKRASKKDIEPFAKINCPAILFPFLRECIADITRRAGFNPLILPSINFVKLAQKKKPENKQRALH